MFSTIDRYLMGRILRTFLPVTLGLCFLFFAGASFRLLNEEQMSLWQVAMALPWVVPFLLPYLLPMAFAGTLTLIYGRMVADNEVLAFGSLGIPGRTLAWPAIVLALLLSAFSAWVTATVVPHCHQKRKEAARAVFQQLFSLRKGEHLSRVFFRQGFDLYVRKYAPDKLEGIVIHYTPLKSDPKDRLMIQLVAERGRITEEAVTQRLVLSLEDVTATIRSKGGEPPIRMHLDHYVQGIALGSWRRLKVNTFASASLREQVAVGRDRETLAAASGGLGASYRGLSDRGVRAAVELGSRTTLSLAPLLMTLLAIPVTLLLRARSALVPFAVGMTVVCGLYFGPFLLSRFLAETLRAEWAAYIGIPCSLLGAAALGFLASRR